MNTAMVISRAVHMGTCLLIFGFDAFAILILPATLSERATLAWRRRRRIVLWCALPLLVISGLTWFLLVTIGITDPPLTETGMRMVWNRTHFGKLWQVRSILAAATIVLQMAAGVRWLRPVALLFSGALLVSIAWSGHGQLGAWTNVHLTTDSIHLLVAGLWPTGLVPLAIMLADRSIPQADAISLLIRFSRMSVICVCILVASGSINTLLTLQHLSDLTDTAYGLVLIGKIIAVAFMVCLGALNRRALERFESSKIKQRVLIEIGLSIVVLVATGWLGTLEP